MAWLFQGVLNAGLQILLSIFGGWLCARLRLVDPEVMSRNVNAFAMKAAYPAFIIHLLGVKTDLRDGEAWRALGVFVLWVLIIHLACFLFHKLHRKGSSVLQLGLNCLLLTTNNTGCIGWPVLIATVGQQSAVLSMLLGVLFFIQLLPVSICCFEYHKWQQSEAQRLTAVVECTQASHDVDKGDQLPVTQLDTRQLALPAPSTVFPHEFRYCYWSNELYQPPKHNPYALLSSSDKSGGSAIAPARLAEVCVESGDAEDEAADHHCYGGGGLRAASRASNSSSREGTPLGAGAGSAGPDRTSAGQEWWRSGRPRQQQAGGLKRAKDSCDSLYTPFAAAAAAAKQQELNQHEQRPQRPSTLGLSSLTRRLSRGLSAAGAAAAAAASAAAAAASPSALVKAASLHTSSSLKKALSLKPAASLRRQPGGRDPLCEVNTPLMEELADAPFSCCPSHRMMSPPCSPHDIHAVTQMAGAGATGRVGDSTSRGSSSSSSIGANSSASGASSAGVQAAGVHKAAGGRVGGVPVGGGAQLAADSAVELHVLCESLHQDRCTAGQQRQRQRQEMVQPKESRVLSPVAAAAAAADGAAVRVAQLPSRDSAVGLHTLLADDSCGRINSDTGRVSSRTNLLLPCCGAGGCDARAAISKKVVAVPAGRSGGTAKAGNTAVREGQQLKAPPAQGRGVFGRFVARHPLLCHIVAGQLQSFHLWLNIVAIALSVSGARKYLDPASPQAIPALGFVDGVLSWFSAACIPTLLFANGVWMCGKDVLCGGWMGQVKVMCILLLKLTLLPALMVALTQLCNIRGAYGLSLVLLASCPLAPLAFLVCQQYGYGAELATSITIQGVLLMLPQMMAVIKVNQLAGLYDVALLGA